jgi:TetR/AcrR family transcriptional regulator, lmrAB and yxaGH operons repressor
MYHHFPGGKSELAAQAIVALGHQSAVNIQALARGPDKFSKALLSWFEHAGGRLKASRFELGCPLATAALELGPDDAHLRAALQQAFTSMRSAIEAVLIQRGMPAAQAIDWAYLLIATFEGGLLQARVTASLEPLERSLAPLLALLDQTLTNIAP